MTNIIIRKRAQNQREDLKQINQKKKENKIKTNLLKIIIIEEENT
jgi:hypothetical protein